VVAPKRKLSASFRALPTTPLGALHLPIAAVEVAEGDMRAVRVERVVLVRNPEAEVAAVSNRLVSMRA
jgi:hypothetical protein